ncbi:MAG TPA: sulfite exporter TauE/SafE family protein [Usitatibacter sp.]|nr:sulfite exporter TauE/SafE family protein [Usitatibacter sp.]
MIEFPYSIAGFVVGAIVGLTGVGGGSLMTPLLVLVFGVAPVTAVGTDLLYAGLTKVGGSISHALKGHVDWRVTGLLAAGSIPATGFAIFLLSILPPAGATAKLVVSTSLGAMLVLTALALAFRSKLLAWAGRNAGQGWIGTHRGLATILTGAFIGFAVTFSSVGAGAVGVTALVLLYPALATVRIVGSDIAHAVPITLLAGLGHLALGNVNGWLLASLLLGSIPGILVGSHLASRLPERFVRHSLVAVLLLAGTKLVLH